VDAPRRVVTLDDGREFSYDVFLGVPAIHAPKNARGQRHDRARICTGQAQDARDALPGRLRGRRLRATGHAESRCLRCAEVLCARAVATALIARLRNQEVPLTHKGTGSSYIEFGAGRG
jgi:hypothetical protein